MEAENPKEMIERARDVANHEAGHFVAHAAVGGRGRFLSIASSDDAALGAGRYICEGGTPAGLAGIWTCFGGVVAEQLAVGAFDDELCNGCYNLANDPDDDDDDDLGRAHREMVKLVGHGRAEAELSVQWGHVYRLLRRRWPHVEHVAAAVLASPHLCLGPSELRALKVPRRVPRRFEIERDRFEAREGRHAA